MSIEPGPSVWSRGTHNDAYNAAICGNIVSAVSSGSKVPSSCRAAETILQQPIEGETPPPFDGESGLRTAAAEALKPNASVTDGSRRKDRLRGSFTSN